MKKRVFVVILLAFVLISMGFVFAATNSTIACYQDSDCGISNYTRYCSGNNSCSGGVSYFCSNPGTPESICGSTGGGGCGPCTYGCNISSGLCNQYCTDSDGGRDLFKKGKIEYFYNKPSDIFYGWHVSEDQCNNEDGTLTEYSCEFYNETQLDPSRKYICSYGCVDGACVEAGCDTHQLSIGEITNNNGNIEVAFKERNVYIGSIEVSLSGISDGGGWGVKCNIVGPSGCGSGSGSNFSYCNVLTDCQYPQPMELGTRYYLTIKDMECNETFDTAEILISNDKDSVSLLKGWNLVSVYSLQDVFDKDIENDLNNMGIRAVFLYDRYNKEYIRLHPNKEQAKLDAFVEKVDYEHYPGADIGDFTAFVHSSLWVYSNSIQDLKFNVYDKNDIPFLEDARLVEGWNFLAVTPRMIGKSLNQWKGNCNVIKAAFWSPEYKKWDIGYGNDFDQVFTEEVLWKGLVVKTSGECYLGDNLNPPELPKDECIDSDGGLNYFIYGWSKGMFDGIFSTFPDRCCVKNGLEYSCVFNEGDSVIESYCDGENIKTQIYDCANGCMDGACIPEMKCVESDGGKNPFVFSEVYFEVGNFNMTRYDSCVEVGYSRLDIVNKTGQYWTQIFSCPNPVSMINASVGDCSISSSSNVDSCNDVDCYVDEKYCLKIGNFYDGDADEFIRCDNGCSNGACLQI